MREREAPTSRSLLASLALFLTLGLNRPASDVCPDGRASRRDASKYDMAKRERGCVDAGGKHRPRTRVCGGGSGRGERAKNTHYLTLHIPAALPRRPCPMPDPHPLPGGAPGPADDPPPAGQGAPDPPPCKITTLLTPHPLDVPSFSAAVGSPAAGAVSTFVGTTRDSWDGKPTLRLEYEAYAPMAEAALGALAATAAGRWGLTGFAAGHRTGTVGVGEASVVIAASSAHRADALAAVAWAIDELKATVPIWKKEVFVGGEVWQENAEGRALMMEKRQRGAG